jgi:hypothetical protein
MIPIQLLIVLIIVLLGVLVVSTLGQAYHNVKLIQEQAKAPCKRHDWTYNKEDKLQCCVCNKIAHEDEE